MSHSIICFFFKPTHTPGTHVKHTHTRTKSYLEKRSGDADTRTVRAQGFIG